MPNIITLTKFGFESNDYNGDLDSKIQEYSDVKLQ